MMSLRAALFHLSRTLKTSPISPFQFSFNQHRSFSAAASSITFSDPNTLSAKAQALLESLESQNSPSRADITEVVELAKKASAQGSPRAKTMLASMHREGFGISQDRNLAKQFFREAADEGDPIAQCSLGVLMLEDVHASIGDGPGVSSSELVLEIDEKGIPRARVELELKDGKSMSEAPTPAEMVRRVRKARRKSGFTDQEAREFEAYKENEEERERKETRRVALEWLEKASEQGNDHAMVALANELLEIEPLRAVELYKRAVKEKRNTDAYYNLGQIYTSGIDGVEVDEKVAGMNFAMAAQLGDATAQYYLGHLYRVGSDFVKADEASARQYIEMSAEQGHPGATYYLALMHLNGEGGLEKSEGAFLRYVNEAAQLGHGAAHACLGDMYYKGSDGVTVDYRKALKHFTEAGKLGEREAYCSAAAMHFHGFGTKEDQHQAFLLYQEAAQLGSIAALRNIGSMYHDGDGIPVNKKVAEYFFKIADEFEVQKRKEGLELTTNTPVRITEAPKHPMANIPRDMEDGSEEEEFDIEKEWNKLK